MRSSHLFSENITMTVDSITSTISQMTINEQPTEVQAPISSSAAFGDGDPFDNSLFNTSFTFPTQDGTVDFQFPEAKDPSGTINTGDAFGNFNTEPFSFDSAFPSSPANDVSVGAGFDLANFSDPFAVTEISQGSNAVNAVTSTEFSFKSDTTNNDPFIGNQWTRPSETPASSVPETSPIESGNFFDTFESNSHVSAVSHQSSQPAVSNTPDIVSPQPLQNSISVAQPQPSLFGTPGGAESPFDSVFGNEPSGNQWPTNDQPSKSAGENDFAWVGAEVPKSSNQASKLASPPPGPSSTGDFNSGWGSSGLVAYTTLVSSGTGPVLSTSSASDTPTPDFDANTLGSRSEGGQSDTHNSNSNGNPFGISQGEDTSNEANTFGTEWNSVTPSSKPATLTSSDDFSGTVNWNMPEGNTAPQSKPNTFDGFTDNWNMPEGNTAPESKPNTFDGFTDNWNMPEGNTAPESKPNTFDGFTDNWSMPEGNAAPQSKPNTFDGFADDWAVSSNTGNSSVDPKDSTTANNTAFTPTNEWSVPSITLAQTVTESHEASKPVTAEFTKSDHPFLPPPQSKGSKNRRTTKTTAMATVSLVNASADIPSFGSKEFDVPPKQNENNKDFSGLGQPQVVKSKPEGNQTFKVKQEFQLVSNSDQDSISLSSNDKFADDWDRHSGVGVMVPTTVTEGPSASLGGADWSALSELDSMNKAANEAVFNSKLESASTGLLTGPGKSDTFTSDLVSNTATTSPGLSSGSLFASSPTDSHLSHPSLFTSSPFEDKPAKTLSATSDNWFNNISSEGGKSSSQASMQNSLFNSSPFDTTPTSKPTWAFDDKVSNPSSKQPSLFDSTSFDNTKPTANKNSDPFQVQNSSNQIQSDQKILFGSGPISQQQQPSRQQQQPFGQQQQPFEQQQQPFGQQQQPFGKQQQQPFGQQQQQQPFGQQQQPFGKQQQQPFGQQQQQQPFGQQQQQQPFGQQQQPFGQQQQQQPFGQQQQPFGQQPFGQQQQPFGQQQQPFGKQQQPFGQQQQQPGQQQQPFGKQQQQPSWQQQQQQPFGQQQQPLQPQPGKQQQPFGKQQQPGQPQPGKQQQQPLGQQQPFGQQQSSFTQQPGQQQSQLPGQQQSPFGQPQQAFGQQRQFGQSLQVQAHGMQQQQQMFGAQQPFASQPQAPHNQQSFNQFTSPVQGQYNQSPNGGIVGYGPSGNFPSGDFTSPPYLIGQSTPKSPEQQGYSPAPLCQPSAMVSPSAFADLLPLALSPQNSKFKVKEDDTSVKSLTESRSEAKKFEKISVPTLNDLKSVKASPKLKPPTGNNFISFD